MKAPNSEVTISNSEFKNMNQNSIFGPNYFVLRKLEINQKTKF